MANISNTTVPIQRYRCLNTIVYENKVNKTVAWCDIKQMEVTLYPNLYAALVANGMFLTGLVKG